MVKVLSYHPPSSFLLTVSHNDHNRHTNKKSGLKYCFDKTTLVQQAKLVKHVSLVTTTDFNSMF